ncbi:toll/interleukin-1 receptor domain-containing protein [Ruegeria arenilitoris]|uniref:toll/interleukin-1 receptor domain-containing protein n=1 Tax=Ruegeria arenilitoris TaxID=1173585 RepID=UPI001479BA93|nr:toll/interleukin-1 receptor domain-containing protein [Ruegeria arenilitoris]
MRVFFSYTGENEATTSAIVRFLKTELFRQAVENDIDAVVNDWKETPVAAGAKLMDALKEQVAECDVFVALVGASYAEKIAKEEAVELARSWKPDKMIVPIFLDGFSLMNWNGVLESTMHLEAGQNFRDVSYLDLSQFTEPLIFLKSGQPTLMPDPEKAMRLTAENIVNWIQKIRAEPAQDDPDEETQHDGKNLVVAVRSLGPRPDGKEDEYAAYDKLMDALPDTLPKNYELVDLKHEVMVRTDLNASAMKAFDGRPRDVILPGADQFVGSLVQAASDAPESRLLATRVDEYLGEKSGAPGPISRQFVWYSDTGSIPEKEPYGTKFVHGDELSEILNDVLQTPIGANLLWEDPPEVPLRSEALFVNVRENFFNQAAAANENVAPPLEALTIPLALADTFGNADRLRSIADKKPSGVPLVIFITDHGLNDWERDNHSRVYNHVVTRASIYEEAVLEHAPERIREVFGVLVQSYSSVDLPQSVPGKHKLWRKLTCRKGTSLKDVEVQDLRVRLNAWWDSINADAVPH